MILITAPTSKIGSQLVQRLIGREDLRLIARDPAKLSSEVRRQAEIVQGSHRDRETLSTALDGVDAVFWLVPAEPQAADAYAAYVDFSRAGCELFRVAGVSHVVDVSALGRGWPRDAGHVTGSLAMDDAIAATGVHLRSLTCATFMDNIMRQLDSIYQKHVFFGVTPPDLKAPTCATADVARVAANLLAERTWTGVAEVPILGPEDLSFREMAQTISEVLGEEVRYENMGMEQFKAMLLSRLSEGMTQAMINMMTAKNEGLDSLVHRSFADPEAISFRTWCETVLRPALKGKSAF